MGTDVEVAESGSNGHQDRMWNHRRPRDEERVTRKPLDWWDRSKFLVLVGVVFMILFLQELGDNPIRSPAEAWADSVDKYQWLLWIGVAELVRQTHFLIAEHWSGYYLFWKQRIFGGTNARVGRIDDWTRFRVGRAFKWFLIIAAFALILARIYDESPTSALLGFPGRFWGWLPLILRFGLIIVANMMIFVAIFWLLSRGGIETYFPEDIDTRFDDVWGQDNVVDKVKENLLFLEDPESIEDRGGHIPGGILLWGPPGTGKTLMAEAAAGETGRPFVFVDPGAFINMFFGIGILKVKRLFRKLRKLSLRYGGVVCFFDEADSLGNRGSLAKGFPQGISQASPWDLADGCGGLHYLSESAVHRLNADAWQRYHAGPNVDGIIMGGMGGGGMGTLQALLTEMSGLKKPRGFMNRTVRKVLGMRPKPPPKYRLLIMMASNMPEALDEALLRPGRLDRIYKVGYPTKEGRKRTYEGYLAKVSHCLTDDDIDKLATITPYATGAVIKDTINEALIEAIRDGREVITWSDIVKAKQLKQYGMADDFEYVERERHSVAVHEACHAITAYRLRQHQVIDVVTIERRGSTGGFVASIPAEDRFTEWRSEYETDLQVALASLAGERLFFGGDNSSGVGSDLQKSTQLATMMVGYWGMGDTVANHGVQHQFGIGGGKRKEEGEDEEQKLLQGSLGDQIETKLADMYDAAYAVLEENRLEVLAITHALETHKTLTGEDVAAIIDGTQGPFIDGRAYYTVEAAQMLEEYHAACVDAHERGADVTANLPEIDAAGSYADALEVEAAAEEGPYDAEAEDGTEVEAPAG